jgi:hypothetical protein
VEREFPSKERILYGIMKKTIIPLKANFAKNLGDSSGVMPPQDDTTIVNHINL